MQLATDEQRTRSKICVTCPKWHLIVCRFYKMRLFAQTLWIHIFALRIALLDGKERDSRVQLEMINQTTLK